MPECVYDDTMFEVTIQVSDGKYSTEMVTFISVVPLTTTKPTKSTTTVSISYQPTDFFSSNNRHSLFLQMHVPVCVSVFSRQERVEGVLGFTGMCMSV